MSKIKIYAASLLVAAVCFFLASKAFAQLDPDFGTNGISTTVTSGDDHPVGSFIVDGGKILVVNGTTNPVTFQFLRFDPDGSPDTSYGVNGRVSLPFSQNATLYKAIRQPDGKIVVVGNETGDGVIARFFEDGSLDTSFSDDGIHRPNINQLGNDGLSDVVIQPDGSLVASGFVSDGHGSYSAIRYDSNGEVDQSFGDQQGFIVLPGGVDFIYPKIGLQSSGKFLVFSGGGNSGTVYRLNSDGLLDFTFSAIHPPGKSKLLRVVSGDRFIIAGSEIKTDSLLRTNSDISVRRYEADGQPDMTFGNNGVASIDVTSEFSDSPFDAVERSDGKIVVGCATRVPVNRSSIDGDQLSLVRLDLNGIVDGKYLATEVGYYVYGNVLLQPDGKVVTASSWLNAGFAIDLMLTRSVDIPLQTYHFHGIPFQLDYSANHSAATIFRPGTGRWYPTPGTINSIFFGLADDILVPSDYLGSGFSDLSLLSEVAVFRPSNGTWYIGKDLNDPAHNFVAVPWGASGDIPAPADYDGDGKSDIAVFRPSTGIWYIRNIGDNSSWALPWGVSGDKPVPGDYDGDGIYDVAVWRPSDGFWYILRSSDGQASYIPFGLDGDIPVQEDYDGDGIFDVALWRPSTGLWYVLRSSDGGVTYLNWGVSTDIPAPADYDGDHITDFAVWRPSTRIWYIKYSGGGPTNPFIFGATSDIPVPGRN